MDSKLNSLPVFNSNELLRVFDGDEMIMKELIQLFIDTFPEHYYKIKDAIQHGDPAQLASAAHTLKGSAANIRAETCRMAAYELEMMGKNQQTNSGQEALGRLDSEFAKFKQLVQEQYL